MIKKTLVLLALSCIGLTNNAVSQSLESSKDIYFQDEFLLIQPIIINYSDGPGNPKDWIGIYDGERLPGDGSALIWSYVDGTDVGSAGKKSGTLQYDKILKPGPYKAYFLENNGYNILATTSFIITDDESDLEPELHNHYFQENTLYRAQVLKLYHIAKFQTFCPCFQRRSHQHKTKLKQHHHLVNDLHRKYQSNP